MTCTLEELSTGTASFPVQGMSFAASNLGQAGGPGGGKVNFQDISF